MLNHKTLRDIIKSCFWIICLLGFSVVYPQEQYSKLRTSPEDSLGITDFPGALQIPNTGLYIKFGGYFRMDAIYDFNGSGSRNQLLMSQIAFDGTPEAAKGPFFNFHVRETRFNLDLRRKTQSGRPLKVFIEFDFFDESLPAGVPRLRHAFIKYGKWTLGQTWTNLSDLRIFPFIMDFSSGDALFGGRAVQIRFEDELSPHFNFGLALEMPGLSGIADLYQLGGETMPVLPIFSARITNEREDGMIIAGGQIQQLRWDGLDQGPDARAIGWGVVFNGRQKITDRLFATWHSSYNYGLVNQILIFGGTDENAVLLPSGELDIQDAITSAVGAGYQINSWLSTNIAYAYLRRGNLDFRPEETLKTGGMGHFNFIWKIDKNALGGIEYAWGKIRNVSLASGNAARLQAMVKYSF